MHWLLYTTSGFDLFTDHNNLIFLFDTTSVTANLSAETLHKVLHWAVRLTMYDYTFFHISGTYKVCADLLGRWSTTPTVPRLVQVPTLSTS